MPSSSKAVIVGEGKTVSVRDVEVPTKVRDEYMLVKVHAVALNPTDWKHIDFMLADPGSKSGCDYAGVVEEVGSKVTKFKRGDRVAGFVHGGDRTNHANGAFGEYIEANECTALKIPEHLDFIQASTLGAGVLTCGQGLFEGLKLPFPNAPTDKPFPVLIHGGSTSTGVVGIQLAKLAGLTVIATCSPSNFEYLKSLGADHVFDYKSPTCSADIRKVTNNKLKHAWDCPGGGEELCAKALSDAEPSEYGAINTPNQIALQEFNQLVGRPILTVAYTALGEDWNFRGHNLPGRQSEKVLPSKFMDIAQELLEQKKLVPVRATVNSTGEGFEGVIKGIDRLRAGKVSGEKLVYTI